MNWSGILLGVATLLIMGLGFFWVIRGERYFGLAWWPYLLTAGLLIIFCSMFIVSEWGSALMGIFGASITWGSTELKEQTLRAELGWYPYRRDKIEPPFADAIRKWPPPHL
jgi:hypothetical protein